MEFLGGGRIGFWGVFGERRDCAARTLSERFWGVFGEKLHRWFGRGSRIVGSGGETRSLVGMGSRIVG
jgi:hypothetical protein